MNHKFSVFDLLLFVACISFAMALTRFAGHFSMIVIVVLVIIPTYVFCDINRWRQVTYGGLLGIFTLFVISSAVIQVLHIHLPRPPIRSGYDTGIPAQQTEVATQVAPFIVPIGFLLGATGTVAFNILSVKK